MSLQRTIARGNRYNARTQPRRPSTARGHKPDTVRTMPALRVLKDYQRTVLRAQIDQFIEAKEKAA